MKQKMTDWIKNLTWEDYALMALILFTTVFFIIHASGYERVPSPAYGGDQYRDRGFVKNIAEGGAPWSDGFYDDEIQYYGYLFPTIEGFFIRIFHTNVDQTFMHFPIIFAIIALLVWYNLGNLLFKGKKWGLILAAAFLAITHIYTGSSSFTAFFIFIPAVVYFWIRYENEGKTWQGLTAGIIAGTISLVYGGVFVGMTISIVGTILFMFIRESIKRDRHQESSSWFWKLLWNYVKKYFLMLFSLGLVACIYFVPLLVKYQLHIVNNVPMWGDQSIASMGFSWMFMVLKGVFFNTSSAFSLIFSLLALAGLVFMLFTKGSKEKDIVLSIFFVNLIFIHHYLITWPLLGKAFWPGKMSMFAVFAPVFVTYAVRFINHKIPEKKDPQEGQSIHIYFIILMIILFVAAFSIKNIENSKSQWEQYGRTPNVYSDGLYNLADYITANVQPHETILSNDESGFMLAVLSGRKVMLTRRTHATYYVDIDKRIAEASVAMYGNDINETRKVLKEYNVKYFYMDAQMFQYPMRTNPGFTDYLTRYNVTFQKVYDRYDVAVTPQYATMMNILLIPPQNITKGFMDLWEPVYTVQVQGQAVGQLYKLKG